MSKLQRRADIPYVLSFLQKLCGVVPLGRVERGLQFFLLNWIRFSPKCPKTISGANPKVLPFFCLLVCL